MNLANLAALLGIVGRPIVIFYILKIRLKRVPVSTVIFWRQIFDEKKPRSLWQKLRHLVSLLVQLALLRLLVAALAKPFFSRKYSRLAGSLARPGQLGEHECHRRDTVPASSGKGRGSAHHRRPSLPGRDGHRDGAASSPQVVCGLTGHQRTLRSAVDTMARDGQPNAADRDAVALGAPGRRNGGKARNTTALSSSVTAAAKAQPSWRVTANVTLITVGHKSPNIAITRFQARRSTIDPIGYEILAEVANLSDEPAEDVRLAIALEGRTIDIKPLKLGAERPLERSDREHNCRRRPIDG